MDNFCKASLQQNGCLGPNSHSVEAAGAILFTPHPRTGAVAAHKSYPLKSLNYADARDRCGCSS